MNAIEYAHQVNELFAVPSTALRVRKSIEDETSDAQTITNIVSVDPGLAAYILKIANSAIYRFPRKIDDLQRAVQVIGTTAVFDYSLIFGISNAFNKEEFAPLDLSKFWENSVACGILAKNIAKRVSLPGADRMFVTGLLHDIGQLVIGKVAPDVAIKCNQFDQFTSPRESQFEELGFTYAEISAAVCQQWQLPDTITSTIAMQHHDNLLADELNVQVIQLATELARINTYDNLYKITDDLDPVLIEGMGFSLDDIDDILDETNGQIEAILSLFTADVFQAA